MDKSRKNKSIMYFISTIISWVIFILLLLIAVILGYYFISQKLSEGSGGTYIPKYSIYTIVSPSMVPTINVYDVIVNTKINGPEDIKEGDIITFISTAPATSGMTITHRVKKILYEDGAYSYITKGDNNLVEDSAPALYSNVIGKEYLLMPKLGYIQKFVSSKIGWLIVVIIPALIIIIKDILKIVKIKRIQKSANKENANMVSNVMNGSTNINGLINNGFNLQYANDYNNQMNYNNNTYNNMNSNINQTNYYDQSTYNNMNGTTQSGNTQNQMYSQNFNNFNNYQNNYQNYGYNQSQNFSNSDNNQNN